MVTDFTECERLVRQVHSLASVGRGDGAEAGAAREQAKSLLGRLSKADRERIEALDERLAAATTTAPSSAGSSAPPATPRP